VSRKKQEGERKKAYGLAETAEGKLRAIIKGKFKREGEQEKQEISPQPEGYQREGCLAG